MIYSYELIFEMLHFRIYIIPSVLDEHILSFVELYLETSGSVPCPFFLLINKWLF